MHCLRVCLSSIGIVWFAGCAATDLGQRNGQTQKQHISIECMILDHSGNVIRKMGGGRCIYLPDGSFITGSHTRLAMINPDGTTKWTRPIDTHHSMDLSFDQKKILVMSMSLHRFRGQRMRFDKLAIYDLQGNELRSFDFYDYRAQIDRLVPKSQLGALYGIDNGDSPKHVPADVKFEYSHANTFNEIPANAAAARHPAFAAGNFVVNSLHQTVFILDKDLKKILWSHPADRTMHDVKVQANGRLLIYRNDSPPGNGPNHSSIEEIDPFTWKTTVIYKGNPPESFSSRTSGGTQWLENGNLLLNDNSEAVGGKVMEVNPAGEIVWSIPYPLINPNTNKPDMFQRALKLDLSEFLKNNKGL